MIKKIGRKLLETIGLALFRYKVFRDGRALWRGTKRILHNYSIQENRPLTTDEKTGILAYYLGYTCEALDRLSKIPPGQKIMQDELKDITVSYGFVQQIVPDMTQWQMLHHFQYGTKINDMQGESVSDVQYSVGSVYQMSVLGLTHFFFKKEIGRASCLWAYPAFIPDYGPAIAYRKILSPKLRYYLLPSPQKLRT